MGAVLGTGRVGTLTRVALTVLVFLLLLPSHALAAAVAKDTSATLVETLPLPTTLVGPESVAFDKFGDGPYSGVSDGRILRWDGADKGWTTYHYARSSHL